MLTIRRRLLLRATALVTILALLLSMVGLTLAAPAAVPFNSPPGVLTSSLVGYWNINEASGTRADSVGSANLTSSNGVTATAGIVGQAANFNGTNQALLGSTAAVFKLGDTTYTYGIWISPTETAGPLAIIDKQGVGGSDFDYSLQWQGGTHHYVTWNVYGAGNATIGHVIALTNTVPAGQWSLVVVWHNATTNQVGIQVNAGTPVTATTSGAARDTVSPFQLGVDAWTSNDRWFGGQMDELALWTRQLTAQEITDIYNAGAGCTYPLSSCDSSIPTATPVSPSGNLIRNPDFTIAPHLSGSIWDAMNRVVQSPRQELDDAPPLEGMPYGSCGEEYWVMSRAGGSDGEIYQDFGWSGGPMFINFEALTDSYVTIGHATVTNRLTGTEVETINFTNGSMAWRSIKTATTSQPAGQYRLGFSFDGFGSGAALAVDNVNVRRNYWGNDCPGGDYHGDMPTTIAVTAIALATPTLGVVPPGTPLNANCGFEEGWTAHTHNSAARLVQTGGAVGPNYAYLFTLYGNGSDPSPTDYTGQVNTPFTWPGGQMYVSWFTGPGTRADITIRNYSTGYVRQIQTSAVAQSYNGWVKRSYGGFSAPAGNYVIEATTPWGQIAALDGIAVSTGGFSSGPCGTQNSSGDNNATAVAQSTATAVAGTATNQPAAVGTAHAVQTNVAAAYATYLAAQYATMTQNARATQTQAPKNTATQAAANTATRSAQQTATAQGTPVPSATYTPQPIPTQLVCTLERPRPPGCVEAPATVGVPGPDDATEIAAQQTADAAAIATFFAAAQQTQSARATATQAAILTAIAGPANATQRAAQTQAQAAIQTAVALHATQTAIANGINALATQQALATQHAQQAAATQTAAAQQTVAAGGNATQQAEATGTAQAYATQYAGVTATANAQSTAEAISTANAQATAHSQATANSAATAISLATQQAGQSAATATAGARQTELATMANPTANAAATTTAQAVATTVAQTTATAQVAATQNAATQQASGTTVPSDGSDLPPVDDRPEPSPGADCERPSSPLQVANWIDYEVCRVLTWFAWSPDNTNQLMDIEAIASDVYPLGILTEVGETMGLFVSWLTSQPWCETGFCQEQPLAPLNIEASGILNGNWDFADGAGTYSDQCTLLMAPLLGPYIQSGMCFCVNVACALGVLPWFQLVFNIMLIVVFLVYVGRTWLSSAHT